MSDINTPDGRQHAEEAAEGDERTPPDEMSSWDIQPPPAEGAEVPGVPDASDALDDTDEPGANATGVGA
jgi:hypothetical protein